MYFSMQSRSIRRLAAPRRRLSTMLLHISSLPQPSLPCNQVYQCASQFEKFQIKMDSCCSQYAHSSSSLMERRNLHPSRILALHTYCVTLASTTCKILSAMYSYRNYFYGLETRRSFHVSANLLICTNSSFFSVFKALDRTPHNLMASLSSTDIAYQKAHIGDDRRATIVVPNVIFTVAAVVAVVLRFESRRIARTDLKADDWWIFGGRVCRARPNRKVKAHCV